mmetsp:Transcript_7315/g.22303  ORF Transcript_7315/g.22303 Transcript_7315/m.22303 type:complete len:362 (+) Transcript_7315:45-1130(+)|eukprot:CAMPEP_0198728500 /NCGR_PEP_ID=MMETSP1475-20131203/9897_1 /TAXON_ID= ORGANISM="Unidentified sp., Strain CCMP1999" /NCGR_SAMPLE_ID=MMETSP1475 /ASSEMBLY_ACC=CAM_ASM_001111 /LENGTH=361 /DNA_ID=CAMNT_0044490897 /DNA_START=11 /DNA_END=1096 /DNA_ORIENTATION=-
MDTRYASLFSSRPRTRGFNRILNEPDLLEAEAQRYIRANEQRELARRKRRGVRSNDVELVRSSAEVHTGGAQIDPWELPSYSSGSGLPERVDANVVSREMDDLTRLLGSLDAEWTHRSAGLERLVKLLERRGAYSAFTSAHAEQIKHGLVLQLTDLRSTLVKDACSTIARGVELAPVAFEAHGDFLLAAVFHLLIKTTRVVRDAGDDLAQRVVRAIEPSKSLVVLVCETAQNGQHHMLRESCTKYLSLLIDSEDMYIHQQLIEASLLKTLTDPSAAVRSEAKEAFLRYGRRWKDEAERLFKRMDPALQRKVRCPDRKAVSRVPVSQLRREALKKHNVKGAAVPLASSDENDMSQSNSYLVL